MRGIATQASAPRLARRRRTGTPELADSGRDLMIDERRSPDPKHSVERLGTGNETTVSRLLS